MSYSDYGDRGLSIRKKPADKKEEDLSAFETTEVIRNELEEEDLFCSDCGTRYKTTFKETVKYLKFVPAHFEVTKEVTYVYSCPRMVLFQYERTRGGYHPLEFLGDGFRGYLTCDGYQAYHGLPESILVTGCMAHARRRFDEALTSLKKGFSKEQLKETTAYQAMERIGMLYKITWPSLLNAKVGTIFLVFLSSLS